MPSTKQKIQPMVAIVNLFYATAGCLRFRTLVAKLLTCRRQRKKKNKMGAEEAAFCRAFGENLRKIRMREKRGPNKKEWTLAKIAAAVDLSVQGYQLVENGESWPKAHRVVKIIRKFEISFEALIGIRQVCNQDPNDNISCSGRPA